MLNVFCNLIVVDFLLEIRYHFNSTNTYKKTVFFNHIIVNLVFVEHSDALVPLDEFALSELYHYEIRGRWIWEWSEMCELVVL
jgi:hypothetical protein